MPKWRNGIPACRQAGALVSKLNVYYVYILQSLNTGEFYKGLTDNIERRLHQHELGQSPSTRNKLPLKLIHVELCINREEARIMEKFFKSGYGREIIKEFAEYLT